VAVKSTTGSAICSGEVEIVVNRAGMSLESGLTTEDDRTISQERAASRATPQRLRS